MREKLYKILKASLEGANPYLAVKSKVKIEGEKLTAGKGCFLLKDFDKIIVIGAGKASLPMSAAIVEILADRIDKGIVVTKHHEEKGAGFFSTPTFLKSSPDLEAKKRGPDQLNSDNSQQESNRSIVQSLEDDRTGYTDSITSQELLRKISIIEAAHPIPDLQGQRGAHEIIEMLKDLTERDLVICLLSGGASALIPAPVEGLSLAEKQSVTSSLLQCGASINEINTIRKHLSRLKGGRMARLSYPATTLALILSDVIGDPLDVIASGPTVGDPTTFKDCCEIIQKYKLEKKIPPYVLTLFKQSMHLGKGIQETPKPGDPVFSKVTNVIIGNNFQSLQKAAAESKKHGFQPLILTSCMEGEAREVGKVLGSIVKEIKKTGNPLAPPVCLLAGGETTVTIMGNGKGGRNQEMALALAINIAGQSNLLIACLGTDGSDGPTEAAGAFVDGETALRASRMGIEPWHYLSENNSYNFFKQLHDLIITGATGTNVMDIFIALIS